MTDPIKPLDPYHAPKDEELAAMSEEDVRKLDAQNREIYKHNTVRFLAAHKVAEMIDPTNRELRSIALKEPVRIHDAWVVAQAKAAEQAEKAQG